MSMTQRLVRYVTNCLLCSEPGHATIECPYPVEEAAHKMAAAIADDIRRDDIRRIRREWDWHSVQKSTAPEPVTADSDGLTPQRYHTDEQIAVLPNAQLRRYVREYQNRRNRIKAAAKSKQND